MPQKVCHIWGLDRQSTAITSLLSRHPGFVTYTCPRFSYHVYLHHHPNITEDVGRSPPHFVTLKSPVLQLKSPFCLVQLPVFMGKASLAKLSGGEARELLAQNGTCHSCHRPPSNVLYFIQPYAVSNYSYLPGSTWYAP